MSIKLRHLPVHFLLKYCIVISLIPIFFPGELRAGELIWNEYSSITQVFNADSSDLDSVRVTNPGIFSLGDTVMFIQMKGVEIYLPPDPRAGKRMVLRGEVPSPIDPPSGCRFHPRCPEQMGEVCRQKEPHEMTLPNGTFVACHLYADKG